MKFLRFVLVVVLAGLIVLGLWKITQDQNSLQSNTMLAPLWERLTDRNTQVQQPTLLDEQNTNTPTNTNQQNDIANILIPELTFGTLWTKQYSDLLTVWSIYGNSNADYLMIEYCDYTIQRCRQAERDGSLIAYQDILRWNLGYIRKPFALSNKRDEQIKHHALWCAQRTGNESQVNRLYALLFQLKDKNDIRKAWEELDIKDFASCLIQEDSSVLLTGERERARDLFDISKLPSYVLIDTRTLDWTLIPGLYDEALVVDYLKDVTK